MRPEKARDIRWTTKLSCKLAGKIRLTRICSLQVSISWKEEHEKARKEGRKNGSRKIRTDEGNKEPGVERKKGGREKQTVHAGKMQIS